MAARTMGDGGAPILQDNRFLFVEAPVGPGKLLLESYTGHEAVSELFSFQLELLSENQEIDFADMLGGKIKFGVAGPEGSQKRFVEGIVTAFSQLPSRERVARYRATVSPSVWKLTRKRQSRIFQSKSVPDILHSVLDGFDVDDGLQRAYEPREYCVQYRESDFEFISRLMEEEGIFYFFKQDGNGDKLVLADSPVSYVDIPGGSDIVYDEIAGAERDETRIFDWQKTQRWDSGKYTLWDHCFELPHKNLHAEQEILASAQVGTITHKLNVSGNSPDFEIYDYPGGYAKHYECGSGDNVSKINTENSHAVRNGMERVEAAQFVIRGQSNAYTLIPGYRFKLQRHFNGDGQYTITSVTHSAREGAFYSGTEKEEKDHFSNIFTCVPSSVPCRPQCVTAKPIVRGCQTAYVVGPSGEEIYTDKYGRVKVQFHWDREGTNDDKSSCWIRVASFWAGKQWGAIHLPRIGQEVVVDFLEGDPDRPIVVGSVYNAENMPPYALPDNKTQSTLKSRSSKSGGTDNFNEIRFEDKKGSEEVYFQAEKDLNSLVKHDETRDVKHDRTVKIENDDTKEVTHDLKLTVGNDRTSKVGNNDDETVSMKQTIQIGQDQSETIGGKRSISVAMNNSETVGGSETVTIGQSQTVSITASESHTAMSRTTTIQTSDSKTVGTSVSLMAGASVTLTAGAGLTITSGGPISITAPMISLSTAMLQVAGVVQCSAVISPTYTPGAGNML
jgi:type VI secretion system secreted protein VgrG